MIVAPTEVYPLNTITAVNQVTAINGITSVIPESGEDLVYSYTMGSTGYLTSTFDSSTIGAGDISVSCWVKTPTAYDSVEYIWVLGNDDLTDSLALRVINSKLQIIGQVGGGGVSGVTQWNPLLPDQWTHVVVTRTGTSINIYINGTNYYYSSHANFGADLSGGETWVGYQGGARAFNGDIANIEVRNAVLTASEIYNNFRSNTAYTTGTAQDLGISLNGDATESVSPIPLGWSNKHSFYFDGVNDHALVSADSAINISGDISLGCWVKLDTLGVFQGLISKRDATGTNYQWNIRDTNVLSIYDGSTVIQGTVTVPSGSWVHLAVVVDSGTSVKFYINGVPETLGAVTITSDTSDLYLGAIKTTSALGSFLEGHIDEAFVTASALTDEQITAIYNASTPQDISPTPNYYLHEGSGADWSGNNIAAILQSGAVPSSDVPVLTIPDWTLEHSLDFNGTDQYGVIPDADTLSFGNGSTDSAFSVGMWVNMDSADGCRIISKAGNSSSNKEWALYSGGGGDRRLGLLLHDISGNFIWVCTSSVVTAYEGQWIHVLATYDGSKLSGGVAIYINGVAQSTTVVSGGTYSGMSNTSTDVTIASYGGNTSFGDFQLASGGIWSVELDADAALFLAQNPSHDLNVDSGDYDYSSSIVAAHAIETGFGPYVIDYSGNGHHATAPSGAAPTWTTDVPSDTRSIDLDGVDDIVVVSDNDVFSFGDGVSDSAFSVVIICKMDDDDRFRAINKSGASNREWAIGTNSSGQPYFQLWSGGGSTVQLNVTHNGGGFSSDQGLWVMYAGTYDGSGNVSGLYMYRNGVDVSDTRLSIGGSYVAMSNTAQDVQIGKGYGNIVGHGKIFTAGIWNNVLTAAELVELWNGGNPIRFNEDSGNYTSSSDLIEEWPMNEGGGNTAAGVNGYDATLTPTGEPLWTLDVPNA